MNASVAKQSSVQIGNIQIGNDKIGNKKIGNADWQNGMALLGHCTCTSKELASTTF